MRVSHHEWKPWLVTTTFGWILRWGIESETGVSERWCAMDFVHPQFHLVGVCRQIMYDLFVCLFVLVCLFWFVCFSLFVLVCLFWFVCFGLFVLVCLFWFVCFGLFVLVCLFWFVCFGLFVLVCLFWFVCFGCFFFLFVLFCLFVCLFVSLLLTFCFSGGAHTPPSSKQLIRPNPLNGSIWEQPRLEGVPARPEPYPTCLPSSYQGIP